jgi:hypothetical protein
VAQYAAEVKPLLSCSYQSLQFTPITIQRLWAPEAAASKEGSVDLSLPQYHRKMVAVIERWEWHITAAGPDVALDVSEKELAQFRSRVSNPDNVREFMERWAGEDRDVEEGFGERGEGEGDDKSDNLEIVISDDDDEDDEMADFIVDNAVEDEEID